MVKRVGSSLLWFVSAGWGMNLLATFAGLPEGPGLVAAAGLAAFVGLDPLQRFWPPLTSPSLPKLRERGAAPTAVQTQA
jgi:hypothetical protein